ncbi:F-box/kelch-repeat protein At3g23880-like [Impatiens glandulifera]|uniref:F-box/kelch-repeat protein At3g23880-like n=1 Tax=Impatiens glandulifera TaxID=253017 RepID=UPI001FB13DFA|nr:F-box/kelch-repeat protein At3g23880-like [Impatiens glandulifera]
MAIHVSEDIILEEILSRLPVKSILRFRSVCRAWLKKIDSPEFVQQQLCCSASLSCRNGTGPLLFERRNFEIQNFTLPLLRCDTLLVEKEVKIPLGLAVRTPFNRISVIGSCNGLVAISVIPLKLSDMDWLVIWNPATKHYSELPKPSISTRELLYYGFVYLSSENDYKIIRLVSPGLWGVLEGDISIKMEVYSMKLDSWRKLDTKVAMVHIGYGMRHDICIGQLIQSPGVNVNGVLHWIFFGTVSILSFDMVNEVFNVIQIPNAFSLPFVNKNKLGGAQVRILELNGFLAIASAISSTSTVTTAALIDIWVMREFGNFESWSKYMSFEVPEEICSHSFNLGSWIKGQVILFGCKDNVMLFEPSSSTKSIKYVECRSIRYIKGGCNYYETLIPVGRRF